MPCTLGTRLALASTPCSTPPIGPHKPTFNRLLHPRPVEVELRNAPYTPLQRHLFRHNEPFLNKVEEALDNICNVTLWAGVYSARQHIKQAVQLKDAIGKLTGQLATCYAWTMCIVLSQSIRANDTEHGFIYPIDKSLLCKMRSCTVHCAKLT